MFTTSNVTPENNDMAQSVEGCVPCSADALLPETANAGWQNLAENLSARYPRTVEALRKMEGGLQHLTYISALEERWKKVARGEIPSENEVLEKVPYTSNLPGTLADFDLIYCGGVLGLFSAAVMAQKGYRVMVFDQRTVGTSHREWNISDEELGKFVEVGLFTREEIELAVANRYKRSLVRFYSQDIPEPAADIWLEKVLDVAIDLGTLLEIARRKFEEAGGTALDLRSFRKVYVTEKGEVRSVVEVLNTKGEVERYGARLTVNALGAISPLSLLLENGRPFDGVCPTVGSTAINFKVGSGERELDPEQGDVLLSLAHAQKGRQLIWEGFPGRNGEMTVYVFFYDTVSPEKASKQSLLDLFEDYFELLSSYKEPGEGFAHLKPVYGYIPARHHREKAGSASRRGVISLGDATSPQSALTFCGFGSQVRNLPRITRLLDTALKKDCLEEKHLKEIGAHQTNINELWVFSRFMQPSDVVKRPDDVNRLMNVFCASLNQYGPKFTRRFFQDKITTMDYNLVTFGTAWRHPRVYPLSLEILGMKGIAHWAVDYVVLIREGLMCSIYRNVGIRFQKRWLPWLEKRNPDAAFAFQARREEWLASGWLNRKK